MQNRLKSWSLWVSVFALIAFVSKTYVGYEIPQFDQFVKVLVVASGFGIINNPTDPDKL